MTAEPEIQNTNQSCRQKKILTELTAMTAGLSGYDPEDLAAGSSFLELGFDSLFLTQLATSFSKETGVSLTFRQLFDEVPTLDAVATYVDAALPDDPTPEGRGPISDERSVNDRTGTGLDRPSAPETGNRALDDRRDANNTGLTDGGAADVAAIPEQPVSWVGGHPPAGVVEILSEQVRLMTEQLNLLRQMRGQQAVAVSSPIPVTDRGDASLVPNSRETALPVAKDNIRERTPTPLPTGFGPGTASKPQTRTYSSRQLGAIRRLTERYNLKTHQSKARTQEDRGVHADPRTAAGFNPLWKELVYPIVVERSKGAHLWDIDGNQYIDLLNGFGPNFFGHNAPFVTEALIDQLRNSYEVGPQTPRAGDAARLLCELTGMDRVSWVNTGSEAVQAAIRIARTVTGRDKIVVFSGDYHGNFDEVLVRGVSGKKGRRTVPMAPGIPFGSVGNVIVLDYGEAESIDVIRRHADDIAAVLVEPVQSRRPELQPKAFLHALRALTRERDIVLVFDEVITGFRVRQGGAQEYFDVEADLATYGKIIGGGMPIGVVAGRARFMDTFDGGMWQYGDDSRPSAGVTFFAGTFVRHPLAITAAHASLNYLKMAGPALQEGINRRTTKLATELNTFFSEEGVAFEIPHFASQMFIRNKEEDALATLLFYHLRDRGIHVLEGFPSYMTAAHTDEDVQAVIAAVKDSVHEMQADDLLPKRASGGSVSWRHRFALTDGQRHIWLASQMGDDASCAFNESDRMEIRGQIDRDLFLSAVRETIKNHEAFSIRFDEDGETQWIAPSCEVTVGEMDLSDVDETDRENQLEALLAKQAATPFELVDGPLFRIIFVQMRKDHHLLIFYCHHLVFDGYSAQILVAEIIERYRANRNGERPEISHDRVPFSVYAYRVHPDNPSVREATAYWCNQYKDGVPALVELPTDQNRRDSRTYSGATLEVPLAKNLCDAVSRAAGALAVSKQMLLFSVFSLLVSRLSQSDDFVIGVPAAGQVAEDLETVGYCVNMLPVRVTIDQQAPFNEWAHLNKTNILNAFDHQIYSLTALLDAIDTARSPGRLPLTEIVFNYSQYMATIDAAGLTVNASENKRQSVFYDLFFQVIETDIDAVVCIDYASPLFHEDTVRDWSKQFIGLLEAIVRDPSRLLGAYALAGEHQSVLHGAHMPIADDITPLSLIMKRVAAAPDAPAITFGQDTLSYEALWHRSDQFCTSLMGRGVRPGDNVGLMLDRSPDMLAAMIAVWRAGAAWVPLDIEFPVERVRHMIEDAGVTIVICDAASASFAGEISNPLFIDQLRASTVGDAGGVIKTPVPASDDRAYIIYTSGSSGKPKGVENTHGALANFFLSMADRPGMTARDRLLALTTISFDIALLELFLPLTVGGEIIMASRAEARDGYDLADLLVSRDVTIMQATPATWRLMLDCEWQGRSELKALCGGEAMPSSLMQALIPKVGELWNMYGPTETTVWSSCRLLRKGDEITVGTPIHNTAFYVMGDDDRPVPVGVPGTLWIGGRGVATGYRGLETMTNARFRDDPVSGGRMYNTGDHALIRRDGTVSIRGRLDQQVKIRGHRIELAEVEGALADHPSVSEAAAAVWPDSQDEPMLTGYLIWRGDEVIQSELRQWMRRSLPDHMIPQLFVSVDALPRTPNNKLDRKALPAPIFGNPSAAIPVAPRSHQEKLIAACWMEMLDIEQVSVTDNFFELGGQSLQVVRMVSMLRKRHGIHLTPRAVIFETLEQLAATAERRAS